MILELLRTLLPSLLILGLIYIISRIITNVEKGLVYKALLVGVLTILPAILFMKLLALLLTITLPIVLPIIFYQILSATNEEFFKYLAIRFFKNKSNIFIIAMFIGGGFALSETLYLTLGNSHAATLRSFTSLPIHIITSLVLVKSMDKKRYFILSVFIHILYNLIIK